MPQQISALQLYNLQHIISGDIPTTARRVADIADWTDHYRRMSMGTTSLDRNTLIVDYMSRANAYTAHQNKLIKADEAAQRKRLSAEYMGRADAYTAHQTDLMAKDSAARINREEMASKVFYRAINEGDWDTAKSMVDSFGALRDVYITERAKALNMTWLINALREEAAFANGVQCVALVGKIINAYLGETLFTGREGGFTGHGKVMLTKFAENNPGMFDKFSDVTKNVIASDYTNLKFGDLIELPGAHGHVMMFIGYTKNGKMKFVEAVGGVKEQEKQGVTRWSNFGPEMYQDYEGEKNLRQHVQIYNANYLSNRERQGRGLTKVLRMGSLFFDTEQARELIEYMLPWEDEKTSSLGGQ